MTTYGNLNTGGFRLAELGTSSGELIGASVSQAVEDLPTVSSRRVLELEDAKLGSSPGQSIERVQAGEDPADVLYGAPPAHNRIAIADAKQRVKEAGLEKDLHLQADGEIAEPALNIMLERARTRHERNATIARGPDGFIPNAAAFGTSFLLQAIDPINVASAFIPVVGEARYAQILAGAGESLVRRAAARAPLGAIEGAVGAAVVEPLIARAKLQEGADYTMGDFLTSIAFGAGLGTGLHVGFGGARDIYRARRGDAQYPFGPGEPLRAREVERITARMEADGVSPPELEHLLPKSGPEFGGQDGSARPAADPLQTADGPPARVEIVPEPSPVVAALEDLPGPVKQDVLKASIAAIGRGEPVQVGEMLEAAAKGGDERIAETLEIFGWHGSPHDFDRFDISKLGSGEGAQAYGHGLYFAENQRVAQNYQRSTFGADFIRKARELYDEYSTPDEAAAALRESADFTPQQKRLLAALEADDWWGFDYPHQAVQAALKRDALESFEASPEVVAALQDIGNMYGVKLKVSPDRLLDWDKPLSEQSEFVRNALLNHPDPMVAGTAAKWGHDVRAMYQRIAQRMDGAEAQREAKASELLNDAGILGIKYLDQGSRKDGAATETRNFVMFDDAAIEILEKNGQPVSPEVKAEVLQDMQAAAPTASAAKEKATKGPAARAPRTFSLFEFLAKNGGLKADEGGDLKYLLDGNPFVPGFGRLVRKKGGMSLDKAREAAVEAGYLRDDGAIDGGMSTSTINDLLEAIGSEARGQKVYREGESGRAREVDLGELEHDMVGQFRSVELDPSQIDEKLYARTLQIMHKEGERDALVAYERAVMEDADRYEADHGRRKAEPELAHIPGWDVPDDAGAAPGQRQAAAPGGSAGLGRGEPSAIDAGRAAGNAGGRDREADWRALSETRAPHDEPEIREASHAADQVGEPASLNKNARVQAAERAAAEADELWKANEAYIPEDLKAKVDAELQKLDLEVKDRTDVLKQGAACLAAAVG